MSDYTAHIMLPDAAIGAVFQYAVLETEGVTCATLRAGSATWLSFGLLADEDDIAVTKAGMVRRNVSQQTPSSVPEGYEPSVMTLFEDTVMVITHGRTVVYSEGVEA